MNDQELILAVVVGIVALIIVWLLRKVLLGLGVVGAAIFGILCLTGEIDCPFNSSPGNNSGQTGVGISQTPTRDDIITAVQNHLSGKTYTKIVYVQERRPRRCNQEDVRTDIHAERNPELAKCPYVGATYYVTENLPKRTNEFKPRLVSSAD